MHDLVDLDCNILFQSQSIPLVIDCDYLTLESLTGSIAIFPEQTTIESPFKVHRISRFDLACILRSKGNPLTIDLDLCTGDVEDEAFVPFFVQGNFFIQGHTARNIHSHAVFREVSGRVEPL